MFTECPMSGKLAPYMAAGQLDRELERIRAVSTMELADSFHSALSEEGRSTCLADWHTGTAHIQKILREKFAFWQKLPWHLAGLSHHDEAVARRIALACLSQYALQPDPKYHHRVANAFLCVSSPLRSDLVAFAKGSGHLADYTSLHAAALKLKWAPIVEIY